MPVNQLQNYCSGAATLKIMVFYIRVFAADLLHLFEQVLKTRSTIKSQQKKRENIWRAFHNLRTSKSYVAKWVQFLQRSTSLSPCPIFYQFVSDRAFKELMKAHFIVEQSPANVCIQELSYGEENALRYAAGYIPRALRRKLERSSHPLKEELILCLLDLTEDQVDELDPSEDWTNLIDRGGLMHINNGTYRVILAIETCVRKVFSKEGVQKKSDNLKQELISDILNDDDVQSHWSMLAVNWVEEEAAALLPMIAEQWITVRGFSFTSAWMEKFKQTGKPKSIQKSKGLRKQLVATPTSSCSSSTDHTE